MLQYDYRLLSSTHSFYGSQYDLRCLVIAVLVEGYIFTVMGKADVRKDIVNMQAFKKV